MRWATPPISSDHVTATATVLAATLAGAALALGTFARFKGLAAALCSAGFKSGEVLVDVGADEEHREPAADCAWSSSLRGSCMI